MSIIKKKFRLIVKLGAFNAYQTIGESLFLQLLKLNEEEQQW